MVSYQLWSKNSVKISTILFEPVWKQPSSTKTKVWIGTDTRRFQSGFVNERKPIEAAISKSTEVDIPLVSPLLDVAVVVNVYWPDKHLCYIVSVQIVAHSHTSDTNYDSKKAQLFRELRRSGLLFWLWLQDKLLLNYKCGHICLQLN